MIKAVKKATDILMILSDNQSNPMPLGRIALQVGLNKATCVHIIETLCESLMIQKVSRKEGYILGPMAYYLTRFGPYQQELIKTSYPVLRWLYEQVHATVQLTIVREGMKFIINTIEGDVKLLDPGCKIKLDDLYATATGRTILANMEEEEVDHIYAKFGLPQSDHWPGIDSLARMKGELLQLRQNGLTFIRRANDPKRLGYACAVKKNGHVLAAIGISITQDDYTDAKHQLIMTMIKRAAREINRRISFASLPEGS